jgi:2-hydroxycyclohexanecarboxyl-CoA dehydrogenase
MRLRNKTAFVTGAGGGIGRAIALNLAGEGAKVVVVDILEGNAITVANGINTAGGESIPVVADMTKRLEVESAMNRALERFGAIDILVNNVGWDKFSFFLDSEEEIWDRIIAVNFKSLLYSCKTVLPYMKERGGRVINIASDAGRTGSSGEAVYSGTKGAIIAFSKALAREMVRFRITVNVVCPGLIATPLLESIRNQSERSQKVMDAVTRAIPMGRVGAPEEVAEAVTFFALPEAGYITGQTLSVSGGLTMS